MSASCALTHWASLGYTAAALVPPKRARASATQHQGRHAPWGREQRAEMWLTCLKLCPQQSRTKSAPEHGKFVKWCPKRWWLWWAWSYLHSPSLSVRAKSYPWDTPSLVNWVSWASWNPISSLLRSHEGSKQELWLPIVTGAELLHDQLSYLPSRLG